MHILLDRYSLILQKSYFLNCFCIIPPKGYSCKAVKDDTSILYSRVHSILKLVNLYGLKRLILKVLKAGGVAYFFTVFENTKISVIPPTLILIFRLNLCFAYSYIQPFFLNSSIWASSSTEGLSLTVSSLKLS